MSFDSGSFPTFIYSCDISIHGEENMNVLWHLDYILSVHLQDKNRFSLRNCHGNRVSCWQHWCTKGYKTFLNPPFDRLWEFKKFLKSVRDDRRLTTNVLQLLPGFRNGTKSSQHVSSAEISHNQWLDLRRTIQRRSEFSPPVDSTSSTAAIHWWISKVSQGFLMTV